MKSSFDRNTSDCFGLNFPFLAVWQRNKYSNSEMKKENPLVYNLLIMNVWHGQTPESLECLHILGARKA